MTVHKAIFSNDWFLDSLHKSFLNQTTLNLIKDKWTFLNREFTVLLTDYTVGICQGRLMQTKDQTVHQTKTVALLILFIHTLLIERGLHF